MVGIFGQMLIILVTAQLIFIFVSSYEEVQSIDGNIQQGSEKQPKAPWQQKQSRMLLITALNNYRREQNGLCQIMSLILGWPM